MHCALQGSPSMSWWTDQFRSMLSGDGTAMPTDGEFDVALLVEHARVRDLVGVANVDEAAQLGFLPPH